MKNIAVFGCGGFGREVKMLIDQINAAHPSWNFTGYYDDGVAKGSDVAGHPVLGSLEELHLVNAPLAVVIATGNPQTRKRISESIKNDNIYFPVLVHPSVLSGEDIATQAGEGTVITAGCILTVNCFIGRHVIINLASTIGHDAQIHDFCSLMPAVNVSGEVVMEESVYVGTGAKIINRITVGKNAIVGAGAVVVKNVSEGSTVAGVPAVPLHKKAYE